MQLDTIQFWKDVAECPWGSFSMHSPLEQNTDIEMGPFSNMFFLSNYYAFAGEHAGDSFDDILFAN